MRVAIERFVDATGRATSWIALVIVVLMATNVLLRYLFRTGSVWSQELEWHLLAPLILFGMSYAMQKGEHVRVDIVYGRFSPRAKAAVDFISAMLCAIISVAIVWLSIKYVEQSYVINEQSQDPGGLPYRWALKALIPVGFVVLLLQSLATAAASAARFRETT